MIFELPANFECPSFLVLAKGKRRFVAEVSKSETSGYFNIAWKAGTWLKHSRDLFREKWIEWEPLLAEGFEPGTLSWFLDYFDEVQILKSEQVGKWEKFFSPGVVPITSLANSSQAIYEPILLMRDHQVKYFVNELLRLELGDFYSNFPEDCELDGNYVGMRNSNGNNKNDVGLDQYPLNQRGHIRDLRLAAPYLFWRNKLDSFVSWRMEQLDLGLGLVPTNGKLLFTATVPLDLAINEVRNGVQIHALNSKNNILTASSAKDIESLFRELLGVPRKHTGRVKRSFHIDKESENPRHLGTMTLAILQRSSAFVRISNYLAATNQTLFVAPASGRTLWVPETL